MKGSYLGLIRKTSASILVVSFVVSPISISAQEQEVTTNAEVPVSEETSDASASEESSDSQTEDSSLQTPAADSEKGSEITDAGALTSSENSLLDTQQPDPIFGFERQSQTQQLKVEPDQLDGSLRYEYALTLPPGRNEMAPDLSLVYSSKNTEQISPTGYGWSVNIPYIERVNRKGINKMYTDSIFFSTLDGELKATSSPANEGYGALVENGDFRQYEFDGNYWVVKDKSGITVISDELSY